MKKYWFRSTVFNLAFYVITLIACLICLPTLIMPRSAFMAVVHGWVWCVHLLERLIMNLHFEIRGLEHLPKDGTSYIVAAKHQSPYETFKLHTLFGDPAIILKQELLKIPLWGAYLKKSDVIAIDRTSPDLAISSIQDGARRMKQQGRPIIIFPQGTRVRLDETVQNKPYKVGVARLQEATDLPIIPMALNTGYFWPRSGWLRRPGRVVFEFLPPIAPGMERSALLAKIEHATEEKSAALLNEAIQQENRDHGGGSALPLVLSILIIICFAYGFYWFWVADQVRQQHSMFLAKSQQSGSIMPSDLQAVRRETSGIVIGGFPGPIKAQINHEAFTVPTGRLDIENIMVQSLPFPGMPILADTGRITITPYMFERPLVFDHLKAEFTPHSNRLDIDYIFLEKQDMQVLIKGSIANNTGNVPVIDLVLTLQNYEHLISYLIDQGALDERMAAFITAGMKGLENENGVVTMPLYSRGEKLYAGPFLIGNLAMPAP
ncbi:MAG: hypothetical protein CMH27_06395 [Micavibrio sp.]|nr:hypothetical protein [Micavibrio sp.]|tara:strand:- start:2818 stop:4290 length:1473 start_codon:yes stop_codon:yes gene_type:complete